MLYLSIGLLFAGIFFLLVEAFIPGFGVFGAVGVISLIVSSIIMVLFVPFGFLIVLCEVCVFGAGIFIFLEIARRKKVYEKMVLDESLNTDTLEDLSSYVGRRGIVKAPLRPVGRVDFDGTSIEAYSEGKFIASDVVVEVIYISDRNIIVRALNEVSAS